jgi:cellulose synthase/poly-beta-1,6-N-acetylglucosamine synthase-like glycosyltransferase
VSFLFQDIKSISAVYFLFGTLSIFSACIYIQIHLFNKFEKAKKLKKYPSLCVLIPNYNSSKTIAKCLKSIFRLDYPRKFEVILIDDGSTDNSIEIAQNVYSSMKKKNAIDKKIDFKIIKNGKNIGKAASLNKGMRMTDCEVVACIDSDTYPRKDVLIKMVPYLYETDDTIAVTGFIVVHNPKNLIQKVQELEYYGSFGFAPKMMVSINGILTIPGPMSILKRKKVIEFGGFDEKNLTEDMEMGLKIHKNYGRIAYCPDAIIPTEVPDTIKKLYRQRVRWYRGTIFNLRKYYGMMLNPKYEDFGLFSYPSCFFYVVFIILTFTILGYHIIKDIAFKLQVIASGFSLYSLNYLKYIDWSSLPIVFNSSFLVFFFVFLGLWFYYLYHSMKQANVKIKRDHLPAIGFVIIIYPTLISIFYIISFIKELAGSENVW